MFEYKKGDMVRCKKYFKGYFYEGSEYEIHNVYRYPKLYIHIKGKLPLTLNGKVFYTYFYSKKEIRSLKLKKIEKNR